MMTRAYVSGVLTGGAEIGSLKGFYERIAQVCAAHNIQAYVPHLASDPVKNPGMTPAEVYQLDRGEIIRADLLIAYVGTPSLGVGMEIEIACQQRVPVILLMEAGAQVSRMARGCPGVAAEIRFANFDDALIQFSDWLGKQNHD